MEITKEDIEKLETLKYPQEGFRKFDDPNHPQYEAYKDRKEERAQDTGFNEGIDLVIQMIKDGEIREMN